MLLPLVLAAALMPAALPGSHDVCATSYVKPRSNPKNRMDTEKAFLADIDKHIAAIGGILAKQADAPAGNTLQVGVTKRETGPTLGDAATHFTAIGTDASQADATPDFMKKDAATQKKEAAAFKAIATAANRGGAIAARGSVKDVQAALDAVKTARGEIGKK